MREVAETIGIRELRQHASRYVAMVKEGKRIALTERGELVGYLEPVREPTTTLQRLVAAGQVALATARGTRGLPPIPPPEPGGRSLRNVVLEMRDEESY